MQNKRIDWGILKREFLINAEHARPATWLREIKKWDSKKIESGNTQEKITGWGRERAGIQQEITNNEIELLREEEGKRIPKLLKMKMNVIVELLKRINGQEVVVGKGKNRKVAIVKENTKGLVEIYKVLKIELGEPIVIQRNENENSNAEEVEQIRKLLNEKINNASYVC